jgi:hypothetical protein
VRALLISHIDSVERIAKYNLDRYQKCASNPLAIHKEFGAAVKAMLMLEQVEAMRSLLEDGFTKSEGIDKLTAMITCCEGNLYHCSDNACSSGGLFGMTESFKVIGYRECSTFLRECLEWIKANVVEVIE